MRRLGDILLGTVVSVGLFPLYVIIAVAVTIQFKANPFFVHQRVGQNGQIFNCVKFRTMPTSIDPNLPRMYSQFLPSYGHISDFLRHRHLDELPQIINILKGDMTFVGPRPMIPAIVHTLDADAARVRHSVRPGVAGLWQISEEGISQIERDCKLDVLYVRNRNVRLDLAILMHSLRNALGKPKLTSSGAIALAKSRGGHSSSN